MSTQQGDSSSPQPEQQNSNQPKKPAKVDELVSGQQEAEDRRALYQRLQNMY
jgi:hypothetical protein